MSGLRIDPDETAPAEHRGKLPDRLPLPDDYVWLLFVSFLFGLANAISHGRWQPVAFALLMITLALLGWRFFAAGRAPRPEATPLKHELVLGAVFALLLSMPITALADPKILAQPVHAMTMLRVAQLASMLLIASYLPFMSGVRAEPERLRTARFVAFSIVLLVAGVSVIHITPIPGIDVWTIQQRGGEVLLEGKNPYVWASVPDTDPENSFIVPFVYPPAAVYISAIGVAIFKDVRYVLLGAMIAAGFALRSITRRATRVTSTTGGIPDATGRWLPSLAEDAPALFFWQTPLLLMVVELSWLDPLQVALICAGVAAFVARRETLAAIVFGVAVSSKQSMFLLFPLVGVILRFDRKRWIVMSLAALVPVLPFMVWDFKALKHANFDFMSGLPPRRDALCFTNAVWKFSRAAFPTVTAFVLGGATVVVASLRAFAKSERSAPPNAGAALPFARALVLTYFVFFFFNRWAFANYYFLLTGLAALAAAAALHQRAPHRPSDPLGATTEVAPSRAQRPVVAAGP